MATVKPPGWSLVVVWFLVAGVVAGLGLALGSILAWLGWVPALVVSVVAAWSLTSRYLDARSDERTKADVDPPGRYGPSD